MKKIVLICMTALMATASIYFLYQSDLLVFAGLAVMILLTGAIFPIGITRYTGGLINLLLDFEMPNKKIIINLNLVLAIIPTILFLVKAYDEKSQGLNVTISDYYSLPGMIILSLIGSLFGIILANRIKHLAFFTGFGFI